MTRIDPKQLLSTLSVLLASDGGIKSALEVGQDVIFKERSLSIDNFLSTFPRSTVKVVLIVLVFWSIRVGAFVHLNGSSLLTV